LPVIDFIRDLQNQRVFGAGMPWQRFICAGILVATCNICTADLGPKRMAVPKFSHDFSDRQASEASSPVTA
jgi:hypothetical protein